MEQLSLHIEYLLLRHDCVIVPGLGAFIATRKGAVADHTTGRIIPPTREIGFNSAVSSDDGLLAHSIARRDQVSFEEGRLVMQRETAILKEMLASDGEVTLGRIGTLTQDAEGTLCFRPMRRGAESALAMGRTTVSMVKEESAEVTSEEASASGDSMPAADAEQRQECTAALPDRRYYHFRIRKAYAHVAACLLIVALTVVSFIVPGYRGKNEKMGYASVVPVETIARKVAEVAEQPSVAKSDTVSLANGTQKVKEIKRSNYYLIVATFRTREEADRYMAKNSTSGMNCVEGRKLFRIAIDSAEQKKGLQNRLNEANIKRDYPGAWIWHNDRSE